MNIFIRRNIFLFILFIKFINISNQNDENKKERIDNTIKLILTSMKESSKETSFSIKYNKYNIILENFKIKPINFNNITIQKENLNNTKFIKVRNLKITFITDINIQLFSDPKRLIKDTPFFIDTTFNEIIFHQINDYNITIISSDIIYINFAKNNILSNLNFFDDFNNNINYLYNEENKILLIQLKDSINRIFIERLKEIEQNINLLTYDMLYIFNKYSEFHDDESDFINYIKIDKILTKDNYIKVNYKDNSIKITNVTIFGKYHFYGDMESNFNIACGDKNIHISFKKDEQNKYFEINFEDCYFDSQIGDIFEEKEDLIHRIKGDYANYLNENADSYYKKYL